MRLFLALPLPGADKAALSGALAPLKTRFPSFNWVREENLHVTLLFLGERDESEVPELRRGLGSLCTGTRALSFMVESVVLYRSDLTREGPRYTAVAESLLDTGLGASLQ